MLGVQVKLEREEDEVLGKSYDGRLVRRLVPYLAPYRGTAILALVMLLGTGILDLIPPYLTKIGIDRYIQPHRAGGLGGVLVLYLCALTAGFAMRYGQNYLMQYVGQ